MCDRLGLGVLAFPAARPGADSLLHMCRAAPEACSVAGGGYVNATRIRAWRNLSLRPGFRSACDEGFDVIGLAAPVSDPGRDLSIALGHRVVPLPELAA